MSLSDIRSRLEKGVYHLIPPPVNDQDLPLTLAGYGHDRGTKGQVQKCHYSDVTVFEFVVSGNVIYRENVTDYQVEAGEMFILHRALPHDYSVGPAGYVHKRFVNVRSVCISSILFSVGLNKPQVIRFEHPSRAQAIFREIGRIVVTQNEGYHQQLSMLLYQLILEASSCCIASKPPSVEKAMNYMTEHLSEKITMDDLVEICGGSVRHFSRVFKLSTGEAPMQWLLSQRRKKAVDLICQTDLAIGEIARRVGYPDPLGFSAFFKKQTGKSPSHMRTTAQAKQAE